MYGELVALGTVADVMPLVGENRTLVREGLALFQDADAPRPAGVDGKRRGRGQARHRGHRQLQPGPAAERSGPHG